MDRPATGTHPLPGFRGARPAGAGRRVDGDRGATVICDGRGTADTGGVRRSEPVTDVLPSTPQHRVDRRDGTAVGAGLGGGALGGGLAAPSRPTGPVAGDGVGAEGVEVDHGAG